MSADPDIISAAAAICAALAPYRLQAERLGFRLAGRDGNGCGREMRSCIDYYVHDSGTWLELRGRMEDGGMNCRVRAELRSWCRPGTDIMEIVSIAITRRPSPKLHQLLTARVARAVIGRTILTDASDLQREFARHQKLLRRSGSAPLVPEGNDPWQARLSWQAEVRRSLSYMTPP